MSDSSNIDYWIEWHDPKTPLGSITCTTSLLDFGVDVKLDTWIAIMLAAIKELAPDASDIKLYSRVTNPVVMVRDLESPRD